MLSVHASNLETVDTTSLRATVPLDSWHNAYGCCCANEHPSYIEMGGSASPSIHKGALICVGREDLLGEIVDGV